MPCNLLHGSLTALAFVSAINSTLTSTSTYIQPISTTLRRCKGYTRRRQQPPRELASHRVTTRRNADDKPQDSFKHLQTINIERQSPQPHVCHHVIIVLQHHPSQQLPSLSSHQWTGHKVLYCISIGGSLRYCLRHIDRKPCFRLRRSHKVRQTKQRGAIGPSRRGYGAIIAGFGPDLCAQRL